MMKINNFRGDLNNISNKKEALEDSTTSNFSLPKLSARSHRKLFISTIRENSYRIEVSHSRLLAKQASYTGGTTSITEMPITDFVFRIELNAFGIF